MVRKVVNISDRGDNAHFGADDTDYINRYLNGEDQSASDPVNIGTDTTYNTQKLGVYNSGKTARVQFLYGGTSNVVLDLATVPVGGVGTGQANTYGDFDQIFRSGRLKIANPANTFNYSIVSSAITAARNLTIPLITADDTIAVLSLAQTMTSKTLTLSTIDTMQNTVSGVVQDPSMKRVGLASPRGNTLFLFGAFADHTFGTTGTIANVFDTSQGVSTSLPTTAVSGVQSGLVSPGTGVGQGRRLFGMRIKTVCKVDLATNCRFHFGFTSATALPISDTPLANTDSGVLIGWISTDTNFTIRTNDGTGAATVTVFTGNIPKDANYHTFQIDWTASGNVNVTMDGTVMTFNTRIPATTTNLFFNQVVQTTTTTAKTMTISGTWAEADK